MFQDAAIAVQMPVSSIKKFLAAWALVHRKVFMPYMLLWRVGDKKVCRLTNDLTTLYLRIPQTMSTAI
jgi:hypothetical protein